MKELSVFVDESGDFGGYEIHSPYYIVTMVFHDQDIDITEKINASTSKRSIYPELKRWQESYLNRFRFLYEKIISIF